MSNSVEFTPVSTEFIQLISLSMTKLRVNTAIDCGSLFTNIVCEHKDISTTPDTILLNCVCFDNFDLSLQWLKQNTHFEPNDVINLTGEKSIMMKTHVESFFNVQTEIIDTTLSQIRGMQFLMQNAASTEELFFPTVKSVKPNLIRNKNLEAAAAKLNKDIHRNENSDLGSHSLPAICGFLNSSFSFQMIGYDKNIKFGIRNWFDYKTFQNLAKLLVGTSDYKIVMEMASKGDRTHMDTTISDILAEDPNSPYGTFPPNLPIFAFGKLSDSVRNVETFSNEDRASSLLALVINSLHRCCSLLAKQFGMCKVYLVGEFVQSEVMRQALANSFPPLASVELDFKILKTRHIRAIGAMITSQEDVDIFMRD